MMGITEALDAQLNRVVEAVQDEIARDGLTLLKKVLDRSGFAKSSYLKDYEVYSHVRPGEITFEILLQFESLDIDMKKVQLDAAKAADNWEKASKRIYKIISRGGFNRVARMKDNRRPIPSALNRPRRTKSKMREWGSGAHNAVKDANDRQLEHSIAMGAPRDMNVNRQGKLSIQFARQTRTTKSGIHFPKGKFQGIMKDFMDGLQDIIANHFAPELEKILQRQLA